VKNYTSADFEIIFVIQLYNILDDICRTLKHFA